MVDTNIFIYSADPSCAEHGRCRKLLERWRRLPTPWYTTWGILYEFLRVTTHPQVFPKPWSAPRAWSFVEALLASPTLRVLEHSQQHVRVAARAVEQVPGLRGNLFHDAHTAFLMREHGIRQIYTRDADFHRFSFVEVVDPLASTS